MIPLHGRYMGSGLAATHALPHIEIGLKAKMPWMPRHPILQVVQIVVGIDS